MLLHRVLISVLMSFVLLAAALMAVVPQPAEAENGPGTLEELLDVKVIPRAININPGTFTVRFTMKEGTALSEINKETVKCQGAPATSAKVVGDDMLVKFNREDLVDVAPGDEVMFTVWGWLYDGTGFWGVDYVKVIDK